MSKLNVKNEAVKAYTKEGGKADPHVKSVLQLERLVSACLLWEDTFYSKGSLIAKTISDLCGKVPMEELSRIAVRTRHELKLRHSPLFILCMLIEQGNLQERKDSLVSDTIFQVVSRADEISELLKMYWRNGKIPISCQLRRGLRKIFESNKFDEYNYGKYSK